MRARHFTSIVVAANLVTANAFGAGAAGVSAVANPHPARKSNLSQLNAVPSHALANPHPAPGVVAVSGCNHNGTDILVAMVYREINSNKFRSQGWYKIKKGECVKLFDTVVTSFFIRAEEDGGDAVWGTGRNMCTGYPGPYDYRLEATATDCPDGAPSAEFNEVAVDAAGPYTYTFDH